MIDSADSGQESTGRARPWKFRILELYLWVTIAAAISGRVMLVFGEFPRDGAQVIRDYYWDILISGLVFVFHIVFRQIFGQLPLEYLRAKRRWSSPQATVTSIQEHRLDEIASGDEVPSPLDSESKHGDSAAPPADLLHRYAISSRRLAAGIYGRAGVYLLVGVLVAFSGLVFFYTQTGGAPVPSSTQLLILSLMPRFGILFFIEFIAFFFLRQYRSAMDEFRYFEAVARVREEVVALIRIAYECGTPLQPMDLIKHDSFFSIGTVLEKGQSSEILEARKMEKSEIDLLEKIVDTLGKAKR